MSKKLSDKQLEEILARSDSEHDEPIEQEVSTLKSFITKLYFVIIRFTFSTYLSSYLYIILFFYFLG